MSMRRRLKVTAKFIYYRSLCTLLNPRGEGLDPYQKHPFKRKITARVPKNKRSAARLIIKGEVTHVGYKAWLSRRARLKGLFNVVYYTGKNNIEALLVGSASEIEPLIRDAWKGSRRSKVVDIEEYWFNKPQRISDQSEEGAQNVSWSQGTADCYLRTLNQLATIMDKPREYTEDRRLVGTDELLRIARLKNLFYVRSTLKSALFMSPIKQIGMQRSQTTRVPSLVHYLTDHKQAAKDFLDKAGLPVPQGEVFDNLEEAKIFLKKQLKPVVVKPAVGLNGTGVTVDVRSANALDAAWKYAIKYYDKVIIEELIQGVDIRIVVFGGESKAALLRVPANISGDGKKTVEQLIRQKNSLRMKNPRLRKNLIINDAYSESYLQRQGHSMSSIPQKDEVVFLHLKANICKGADSIGITKYIHPDLMKLAEEAAAAFGINDYWGIDLLVGEIDKPRTQEHCSIIELNSTANIENVIYPLYGESFDSASHFMNHLFPEKTEDILYSTVKLEIKITGLFNDKFYQEMCRIADNLGLEGNIQGNGVMATAQIYGKENKAMYLLKRIYRWSKGDKSYVDGMRVNDFGGVIEEGTFKSQYTLEETETDNKESKPDLEQEPITQNDEVPSKVNRYTGEICKAEKRDIIDLNEKDKNVQLFLCEFAKHGYEAEYLYEGLFKICNDNKTGITTMRHSSLYCDEICDKIFPVKELLTYKQLPVLRGRIIKYSKKEIAGNYYGYLGNRCIATRLHPRKQVISILSGNKGFNRFWSKSRRKGTNNILIEENIKGWQVCFSVISDKVTGALLFEPVSLNGDGVSSIDDLIKEKNSIRMSNPYYQDKLIQINKNLHKRIKAKGKALTSVLRVNERVVLERKYDLKVGGETLNISDIVHKDFQKMAVDAVAAIPGLKFAYVYMILPELENQASDQQCVIFKIDTRPAVAMFEFPYKGKPIEVTKEVVERLCLTSIGQVIIEAENH